MGKRKQQNWVTKPFHNWEKAVAKMKEHSESESHWNACQAEICSVTATRGVLLLSKHKKYTTVTGWKTEQQLSVYFIVHTSLCISILPIPLILVTLLI